MKKLLLPFVLAFSVTAVFGQTANTSNPVDAVLPTGAYRFFNHVTFEDPRTVGVADSSSLDGAFLEQGSYIAGTGQEWIITDLGGGEYTLVNTHSGKALAIPGESPLAGTPLIQMPPNPALPGQRWRIEWLGGYGVHFIRSSLDTTYYACIQDNSTADGARLILNTKSSPENKYFLFQRTAYLDREVTDWFRPTTGWIAGDGGSSLKLSNGKIVWAFGDSHYNDYKDGTVICLFNTRNLVRVQMAEHNFNPEPPNAATLKSPLGPFTYRSHPDIPGSFNWPSPFVEVNGYVYNLLANFRQGEGGTWSYNGPPALGKMDIHTLDPASITYHQIQDVDTIDFAGGFAHGDDGYIYVFGFKHAPDQPHYIQNMYVARFQADSIDAGIWNFWNGSDWNSTDARDAAPVHQGIAAHVVRIGNKYVRSGVRNTAFWYPCVPDEEARKVWVSTSDSPVGPWTPEKWVYTINEAYHGAIPTFYGGWPSAANLNDRNEMLIIYSINGYKPNCGIPETCVENRMNPDIMYRPRAIRVPLELLGSGF